MIKRITLRRVNDDDGKWVYYECSKCSKMFIPNPDDADVMPNLFKTHVASEHPATGKLREDFSRASAQIVKEATERD